MKEVPLPFIIAKLRQDASKEDAWVFTVLWPKAGGCGYLTQHGWRYLVANDTIRRPTARGFQGILVDCDEVNLARIKEAVKREIMYWNMPIQAQGIFNTLKTLHNATGSWKQVYKDITHSFEGQNNIMTAGQWALYLAAAVLSAAPQIEVNEAIQRIQAVATEPLETVSHTNPRILE